MTIMLSTMDQERVLHAFEQKRGDTGSTWAGIVASWEKMIELQDPQQQVACSPRLLIAIKAALPLLTTQQDAITTESVHAVYTAPLTRAQTLRKQADELDRRDAIVNELRAAIREHQTVMQVRKDVGVPAKPPAPPEPAPSTYDHFHGGKRDDVMMGDG